MRSGGEQTHNALGDVCDNAHLAQVTSVRIFSPVSSVKPSPLSQLIKTALNPEGVTRYLYLVLTAVGPAETRHFRNCCWECEELSDAAGY